MLDIKFIRDNSELVQKAAHDKRVNFDVQKLLAVDERRRHVLLELETKRAEQNARSKGPQPSGELENLKKLKEEVKLLEEEINNIQKEFDQLMYQVPNIPSIDTPIGLDESGNKVIRQVGKLPSFDFQPKEHWQLGNDLNLIDNERAAKVSGSRFTFLKKELALLQFALIQFAFSVLTDEKIIKRIIKQAGLELSSKPFVPIIPPVLIKPEAFGKIARLQPK